LTNPYQPPGGLDQELGFAPRDQRIQSLTNKSIVFGVLGLVCCGLIFGPLAINYANQAQAAIILDESGATHGTGYKIGRGLGYVAIGLWVLGTLIRLAGLLAR
jgi:hypothetical protein